MKAELLPDQEINEAVARKLGHDISELNGVFNTEDLVVLAVPNYCRSIEAAWEILEQWKGDYSADRQNGVFHCTLYRPSEEFEAWANSLPMAICLAFLKVEGK